MPSPRADLITHPTRARLLGALMGRQLTIGPIALILPDVPLPSLTTFLNTLAEIFRNYLEQEKLVPGETPHHALMGSLSLSRAEYEQFEKELQELVRRWCDREPGGDRRRLVFAHLMLPDRETPPLA